MLVGCKPEPTRCKNPESTSCHHAPGLQPVDSGLGNTGPKTCRVKISVGRFWTPPGSMLGSNPPACHASRVGGCSLVAARAGLTSLPVPQEGVTLLQRGRRPAPEAPPARSCGKTRGGIPGSQEFGLPRRGAPLHPPPTPPGRRRRPAPLKFGHRNHCPFRSFRF